MWKPSLVSALYLLSLSPCIASDVDWSVEASMDQQLFPSLIISTATVRPEEEDEEPDPYLLGDAYGLLGVSLTSPGEGTEVKVVLKENELMAESTWKGKLEEAKEEYFIAPTINYKFQKLREVRQQVPMNATFELFIDGESQGEKSTTLQVRSINDCPFGVSEAEEDVDDKNQEADEEEEDNDDEDSEEEEDSGYTDMGWMFAAYVNEAHPLIDPILKESLDTGLVDSFSGYQSDSAKEVLRQLFAVWTALQDRGIKYSSITATPGGSKLVYSQHVRFLDEATSNAQANCVDGSVLFASILRKVEITPVLVLVPGHMYLRVNLGNDSEEEEAPFVGLETTLIGVDVSGAKVKEPQFLAELGNELGKEVRASQAWKSFVMAIITGTKDLQKNAKAFESDDPNYQLINIRDARDEGIMPISYSAAK